MDHLAPINAMQDSQLILWARAGVLSPLVSAIEELLSWNGPELTQTILNRHCNKLGKTILHEAAQNGRGEMVEWLLSCPLQLDTNALKQGDWTPLMLACTKLSCPAVVRCLLEHGANVNLKNKDGWTAFHIACRDGHVFALDLLLSKDPECWNSKSKNGRTPLHTAAFYGRLAVIEFLLDNCSYAIDEKDRCGTTPFMDSIRFGFIDIAKCLLARNMANPQTCDNLGRSALHLAAESGAVDAVTFLLVDCQLDADVTTQQGVTAAHLAAKGHVEVLRCLKDVGANFQKTMLPSDRTPLEVATDMKHVECVQYLSSLQTGEETNMKSIAVKLVE